MTNTTTRCTGRLAYVQTVTQEAPVDVDEDGNLDLTDGFDMVDVIDSEVYCSECGLVVGGEYEAHGMSVYWEVR